VWDIVAFWDWKLTGMNQEAISWDLNPTIDDVLDRVHRAKLGFVDVAVEDEFPL